MKTITVKQLIGKLTQFDPNMPVFFADNTDRFVEWRTPDPHIRDVDGEVDIKEQKAVLL